MYSKETEKYNLLAKAANETFFYLYNINLDFKGKNSITFEDDTKYYRVVIDEYDSGKYEYTANNFIFGKRNFQIIIPSLDPILKGLYISIFGHPYNLYDECLAIINVWTKVFEKWENLGVYLDKRNLDNFDSEIRYYFYYLDNDNNIHGSFYVIFEDKDDTPAIEEMLEQFWKTNEEVIPDEKRTFVKLMAEFIVVNFGIVHNNIKRRNKLVNAAVNTFYQLYNISVDFEDKNMITYNDDMKFYKIIIEEFPKKYDGISFVQVKITNGRIEIPDIPSFLNIRIFGRPYNLKEEFETIMYLFTASIDNGEIIIYKYDYDLFEAQIRYRCYLSRKYGEKEGAFQVTFEDKDDLLEIEETVKTFWDEEMEFIPEKQRVVIRIITEFVVTTHGIWHNIADRYNKIVTRAIDTIYNVYNITVDFNDKYVFSEHNDYYTIKVIIDEYPEDPKEEIIETYFNITQGRVTFPKINYAPEVKLELFDKSFDIETEYKALSTLFASGIRNGKVYLYKANVTETPSESRFKCYVYSESGDEYGAFEIYFKDNNDEGPIMKAVSNFWSKVEKYAPKVNSKLAFIANFVSEFLGHIKDIIKPFRPTDKPTSSPSPSSDPSDNSSYSSYITISPIFLLILISL